MTGTARTAIARTRLSLPMRWLHSQGLLSGRVLDYGCGRGFDCDTLGFPGYDPYFRPATPEGVYDTITCIYVLNVLEDPRERQDVLDRIKGLLSPTGRAYIAVRNDVNRLRGATSRGTWQGLVILPFPRLKATENFVLYDFQ